MPKNKKDLQKGTWDRKKTAIVRQYRKLQTTRNGISTGSGPHISHQNDQSKTTFFNRAMEEYERKKAWKEEKKRIREAKQKEKDEKIKKYVEKKRENFKKLSAKTKWGQPVMKGRMEILLDRIQKSVNNDVIK